MPPATSSKASKASSRSAKSASGSPFPRPPAKEILAYVALKCLMPVVAILPMGVLSRLCHWAGWLCFRVLRRERQRILLNLRLAYGDCLSAYRLRLLGQGVLIHTAKIAVECFKLYRAPRGAIKDIASIHNYSLGEEAFARGKGFVLLTAHAGNWEYLSVRSYEEPGWTGVVIARTIRSRLFRGMVHRWRKQTGMREWYTHESPKIPLNCLRRNKIVGILNDQDILRVRGIFVDFFGIPAYTPRFISDLSYKTGAPMVVILDTRRKNGTHVIKAYSLIAPLAGESMDAYALRSQQEYAGILERHIRRHPTQWVWFHKRWKTRPWEIKEKNR